MSDCKAYRHEIAEAFDGGALSRGASAHADVCRACGDELRGRERLRALVRGLGKVEAPADFEYRLRARMSAGGGPGRRAPLRGLRLVYAFAPVAAAACFLVVSTALYLRQAARTDPAEAPAAVVSEQARQTNSGQASEQAPMTNTAVEVKESKPTGVRPIGVASATPASKARPAIHGSRVAPQPSREVADGAQRSETLSLTSARVINGSGMTIALKAPLRVVLRDESGAGRVVPMRAVSFGSQELLGSESISRNAAADVNEGVW